MLNHNIDLTVFLEEEVHSVVTCDPVKCTCITARVQSKSNVCRHLSNPRWLLGIAYISTRECFRYVFHVKNKRHSQYTLLLLCSHQ